MAAQDQKITIPSSLSQEELTRRVAERVLELWRREVEHGNERQGKKRGK